MDERQGLDYVKVWVDETIADLLISGERPAITGLRLRLWLAAAKGTQGPIGILLDDDALLARLVGIPEPEWLAAKPFVVAGWTKGEGWWTIPSIIAQARKQRRDSRRARAAAKVRWHKQQKGRQWPTEAAVMAVYQHYLERMGKTEGRYRLTPKRTEKIRRRLKDWDPTDGVKALCDAIDACAANPFNMGDNDNGRCYNDLADHILRTEERVEQWIEEGEQHAQEA